MLILKIINEILWDDISINRSPKANSRVDRRNKARYVKNSVEKIKTE
ncbi:MAG: hypothetical protein ACRD80_07900 [Nitrososphaeraceae archaeon]